MADLLNILCCPLCKNEIILKKDNLECKHCNISYKINDNIPNMLPSYLENNIQKTVQIWNDLPYDYDENISETQKYSPEYIKNIDAPLIELVKGNVLEVGCGTARLEKAVKEKNCNYFGIEPSFKLLKQGSKKGIDNLVCGVGEYLPFKDNSFDTIIGGYHSFRYINLELGLAECARVLNPSGRLAFSLWNFWYLYSWLIINLLKQNIRNYALLRNVFPFKKTFTHNDVFWINNELNILQLSGFEIESIITTKKLPIFKKIIKTRGYWKGKKGSLIGRDIIIIAKKKMNFSLFVFLPVLYKLMLLYSFF